MKKIICLCIFLFGALCAEEKPTVMDELRDACSKYIALPKFAAEADKMLKDLETKLKNKISEAEFMDKTMSIDSAIRSMLLDWLAANSKWLRDPDQSTPEQKLKASVYVVWVSKHNIEPSSSWQREEIGIKRWLELLNSEIQKG